MLWFAIIAVLAIAFGLGALLGAPYLPILDRDREPLLDLAAVGNDTLMIDLGSGDGRLLRAAARRGARVIGYEINPFLYLISLIVTYKYRQQTTIHLGDFWKAKLPPADVIYAFLIDRYMSKLDHKLTREITRPTTVISFVFKIPGRKILSQNLNSYRYEYGQLEIDRETA